MKIITGIYKIISPSGKIYIGQSTDIEFRKSRYEKLFCKRQIKLYNSLKKYGFENHKFEVLEECPELYLDELETWWKLFYNSVEDGLNCNYWDYVPMRGKKHKEESKLKISNANLGREQSEETRQKRSRLLLNKPKSESHKINISLGNKGKKKSENHVKKLYKPVNQYNLDMKLVKEWDSVTRASKELKIKQGDISSCCSGRIKSAGKFIWKYKR